MRLQQLPAETARPQLRPHRDARHAPGSDCASPEMLTHVVEDKAAKDIALPQETHVVAKAAQPCLEALGIARESLADNRGVTARLGVAVRWAIAGQDGHVTPAGCQGSLFQTR